MSLISKYVREDRHYSVAQINELFGFDADHYKTDEEAEKHCRAFIKELRSRNILKSIKENNDEDEEIADIEFADYYEENLTNLKNKYKFSFVGIAIYRDAIIYSYPKYIGPLDDLPERLPKKELAQVIRVIEKYSRDKKRKPEISNVDLFTDIEDGSKVNILSVMLYLLEDYAANGPYLNDELIIETNGPGEIIWQKTVDETDPVFQNGRPYYVELFTRRNVSNDNDYFTRLHEYAVTQCSKEMEKIGLTDFFSLPVADISDDEEDVFGDKEYICNMIDAALATTFDDRKITVLKALKAYFNSCKVLTGTNELQLIGTRSFNLIWEEVCGEVFRNQKDEELKETFVPKPNQNILDAIKDKKQPTLIQLIEHPKWVKDQNKKTKSVYAEGTLKPDYLGFNKQENETEYYFYILDAKYYRPIWGQDSIDRQPGIGDITKQYLYRLAYADYLADFNVKKENVKNYFLMPKSDDDHFSNNGFVELEMMKKVPLDLGKIEVRMLNPEIMYDCYLKGEKRQLEDLDNGSLCQI